MYICYQHSMYVSHMAIFVYMAMKQNLPTTISITITLIIVSFFSSLARSKNLSIFFTLFCYYFVVHWNDKIHETSSSFFFIITSTISISSDLDVVIRLFLKVPENFICLILLNGFSLVHIPFGRMVKFYSLAQFPVDHFSHPVLLYTLFC